jgi:hypothetical protein
MLRKIIPLLIILLLSGCAITHNYGPYQGKVVDKKTGEPIEGAVVFLRFYTEFGFSPGGAVSKLADVVETLTNENGEYFLPVLRVSTMRAGSSWKEKPHPIIFKPGYGAYPRHPDSTDGHTPRGWLRVGEKDLIKLPKLQTRQNRLRHLRSFEGAYDKMAVSCEKQRYILSLYNSERISLGLEPAMTNKCGEILGYK